MYVGEERSIQDFGREKMGRDLLVEQGVDGRILLKWFCMIWVRGMDWIDLVQDRDRCAGICECGNEPSGSVK